MNTYEQVHDKLKTLHLEAMDSILDNYIENAKDKSFLEILEYLLDQEIKNKKQKTIDVRLRYSGFPFRKTLDEFDFTFQPSIDKNTINELRTLRFIYNKENVIFLGPPGVGKTHLAIGIGMEAIRSGILVYYISTVKLIQNLKRDYQTGRLEYKLRTYNKFPLMIIDEIGYLLLNKEESNLLFQFVSYRYEHNSTIFTSNKSYSEWGEILGDEVIASAILDRILHHSTTVNIKGESYRLKERKKMGLFNPK